MQFLLILRISGWQNARFDLPARSIDILTLLSLTFHTDENVVDSL